MIRRIESGLSSRGMGFEELASIKQSAVELHIKGIVFIRNDGSIKVIAEGEDTDLTELTKRIKHAACHFPTENFYVTWAQTTREFNDFSIKS